jgi:glycolate oxidase FAD binding subunit
MGVQTSSSTPHSIEEIQTLVRNSARIVPDGGLSKPALSDPHQQATRLDLRRLTGILEYLPGEYTFTAYAGTPLAEIEAVLAENGQYLPFDPPLVQQGATLGGTVAAGLSGSGRYRYGGVRDFLIGVRFVDGQGRLVRGGGKVVKNAAGFDLPKLMVGSLGRLGILVELTFKVFPRPQSYTTMQQQYATLADAINGMHRLAAARMDIHALDIVVDTAQAQPSYTLTVRLGGLEAVMHQRLAQMRTVLGGGEERSGSLEDEFWSSSREFGWVPADFALVKVATTPAQLPALEQHFVGARPGGAPRGRPDDPGRPRGDAPTMSVLRRYAVGGNLTWIAWPHALSELHDTLLTLDLSGVVLRGAVEHPLIGAPVDPLFIQRIKKALDPAGRFLPL